MRRYFPRPVRFAAMVGGIFFAFQLLMRLAFLLAFKDGQAPASDYRLAFWIGAKFDLRLSILLALPALLAFIPWFDPARRAGARRLWLSLLGVLFAAMSFLYILDFGHYGWLNERLNASALENLEAPAIAAQTVWESYPVVWIFLGWFAAIAALVFVFDRVAVRRLATAPAMTPLSRRAIAGLSTGLVLLPAAGVWGKKSAYPLRWSDAYFSKNEDAFTTALALNPVLFSLNTLANWRKPYDEKAVRASYPLMSKLLEVEHPDDKTLTFQRHYDLPPRFPGKHPNVVVIFMESFSALKTGAFHKMPDLDPTPNVDAIIDKSVFFTHFFVPRPPTARAIFATLFSLGDVNPDRSASRNPLIVHQNSVANAFEGYQRIYMLGGSAAWGEIRGMLDNLHDLDLHEEGSYKEKPDDVWGVNDMALLEEANETFKKQDKPFVAFIQLAGNHPPYTIPKDHGDFQLANVDDKTLDKNGFLSLKAYNGIRFMDYAVGNYFKLAQNEKYFDDTIYFMYGDHGVVTTLDTPYKTDGRISSHHIPGILYAPKLLPPQRIDHVVSSVDVLPTLAQLAGVPFDDEALGRPIFVDRPKDQHFAYFTRDEIEGVITDDYVFDVEGKHEHLYAYDSPTTPTEDLIAKQPEDAARLRDLLHGLTQTSRWMLYHNGSEKKPAPATASR